MSEDSEHYLVCLDGSDNATRAARWAARLANLTKAKITLLHVVPWDSHVWAATGQVAQLPELREQLESDGWTQILTPMEQSIRDGGVSVECQLLFGKPAEAVGEVAEELGATLVVAGTRGQSTLTGLIVGSVSHRLLQVAKRPVALIP